MRRKQLLFAAMAALLWASLTALPASAGKTDGAHFGPPTPLTPTQRKALCTATGVASVLPGISDTPTHNSYDFVGVTVTCLPPPASEHNLAGTYDVTASGRTDGPDHVMYWTHDAETPPNTQQTGAVDDRGDDHGEDCEKGWGVNGAINVAQQGSVKAATGEIHFVRVGKAVTAWGTLTWNDGKKADRFLAQLAMTPSAGADALLACKPPPASLGAPKIVLWDLTGKAHIYN